MNIQLYLKHFALQIDARYRCERATEELRSMMVMREMSGGMGYTPAHLSVTNCGYWWPDKLRYDLKIVLDRGIIYHSSAVNLVQSLTFLASANFTSVYCTIVTSKHKKKSLQNTSAKVHVHPALHWNLPIIESSGRSAVSRYLKSGISYVPSGNRESQLYFI
jgi:hypothetical protein